VLAMPASNELVYEKRDITVSFQIPTTHRPFVEALGKLRFEENQKRKNPLCDFNPLADTLGVLGELALQILTGIPMNLEIGVRDKFDFQVEDLFIDVKASGTNLLRIKEKTLQTKPNFIYCLCQTSLETFYCKFCGIILGEHIPSPFNKGELKPGKNNLMNWVVKNNNLRGMWELKNMIRERNGFNKNGIWVE